MTGPVEVAADRHRRHAGHFTRLALGTPDWDAPSPVEGWRARDVVDHLVSWLPGFLAADGVDLPAGPLADADPVAAWRHHADAVQALLDDPDTGSGTFSHPRIGELRLDEAIDRFYTTDVFLHCWDLARAGDQPAGLEPGECAELLAGLEPLDELLRSSGQYGARVPVPADAPPLDRLVGFIGRDPAWTPPAQTSSLR